MEHLSLYELNQLIGETLSLNLEPSYWVVAEIGEMRIHRSGHCYMELVEKEGDTIRAKMRATIWSYTYRNLSGWFESLTGQSLKAGMKILFNAKVQFHEVYGLSLNIQDIDAQYTLGERARRRKEIIEKLLADGVFDMNKELDLPLVPQHIAVISSETAAGFGDFTDQLQNNEFGYRFAIRLFPAIMQGERAEASIIDAMHRVHEKMAIFDLLVIIRGGGASLDLDCFDSYELGSHIAQFPLPVITGIGHERDETIADMVAHTRMKTPTAVAEFLITGMQNFEMRLDDHFEMLTSVLSAVTEQESSRLDQLSFRFHKGVQQLIHEQNMALSRLWQRLSYSHGKSLNSHELLLGQFAERLKNAPAQFMKNQQKTIAHLEKELEVLNPENVLRRGYSITTLGGVNINKLSKIHAGATITTVTARHKIESKVSKSEKKKDHDS